MAMTVVYLTTAVEDVDCKKVAAAPFEGSFAPSTSPGNGKKDLHCVASLERAFELAMSKVESGLSVMICVSLRDRAVDVQSETAAVSGASRGLSHAFCLAVTLHGVHLFHAHSPRGFSLAQYLQADSEPWSHSVGRKFAQDVTKLLRMSVDDKGIWSEDANELFESIFGVNLNYAGSMGECSPFCPYLNVSMYPFTVKTIHENLMNLPQCPMIAAPATQSTSMTPEEDAVAPMSSSDYGEVCAMPSPPRFADYPQPKSQAFNPSAIDEALESECAYCRFASSARMAPCSVCLRLHYCCLEHERKHRIVHKDKCSLWADLLLKEASPY